MSFEYVATGAEGDFDAIVGAGNAARKQRACPKCGGKAMWHATSAYCTKSKCGWFEVVKAAPRRIWCGPFTQRFILTCTECGLSIMPGEEFFSDTVSGHLVRHDDCHEEAEAS